MAVAGLVKLRKHQFGRQGTLGTKVPATRAYPFRGTPDVNLNWTDQDVDAGSLDPTADPYRGALAASVSHTTPALKYDDVPLLLSGFFGNAIDPTGGGTAKTWAYAPSSTEVEEPDVFTYEFGDDVLDDWFQLGDGIIESIEISGAEGLGPLTATINWRFGSAASTGSTDSPVDGDVPTPDLSLDLASQMIYFKDGGIFIASALEDLETSQILQAWHAFTLRFSGDLGEKRYADGLKTFDIQAWARETRAIELEATFAKTPDIVGVGSEADAWMSDTVVTRYVRLYFESVAEAETGIFYSLDIRMPMRYYTRGDSEIGGNSTVVLTGHAFYEPTDFEGAITAEVVNQLADL